MSYSDSAFTIFWCSVKKFQHSLHDWLHKYMYNGDNCTLRYMNIFSMFFKRSLNVKFLSTYFTTYNKINSSRACFRTSLRASLRACPLITMRISLLTFLKWTWNMTICLLFQIGIGWSNEKCVIICNIYQIVAANRFTAVSQTVNVYLISAKEMIFWGSFDQISWEFPSGACILATKLPRTSFPLPMSTGLSVPRDDFLRFIWPDFVGVFVHFNYENINDFVPVPMSTLSALRRWIFKPLLTRFRGSFHQGHAL